MVEEMCFTCWKPTIVCDVIVWTPEKAGGTLSWDDFKLVGDVHVLPCICSMFQLSLSSTQPSPSVTIIIKSPRPSVTIIIKSPRPSVTIIISHNHKDHLSLYHHQITTTICHYHHHNHHHLSLLSSQPPSCHYYHHNYYICHYHHQKLTLVIQRCQKLVMRSLGSWYHTASNLKRLLCKGLSEALTRSLTKNNKKHNFSQWWPHGWKILKARLLLPSFEGNTMAEGFTVHEANNEY